MGGWVVEFYDAPPDKVVFCTFLFAHPRLRPTSMDEFLPFRETVRLAQRRCGFYLDRLKWVRVVPAPSWTFIRGGFIFGFSFFEVASATSCLLQHDGQHHNLRFFLAFFTGSPSALRRSCERRPRDPQGTGYRRGGGIVRGVYLAMSRQGLIAVMQLPTCIFLFYVFLKSRMIL